jgi:hypothetical protein
MKSTWFIVSVHRTGQPHPQSPSWCAYLCDHDPKVWPEGALPKNYQFRYLDLGKHKTLDDAEAWAEALLAGRFVNVFPILRKKFPSSVEPAAA